MKKKHNRKSQTYSVQAERSESMGKYRIEKYLEYLNGEDVKLPEPFTKQEKLLYNICKKGVTGNTETDKTLTQEGKPADAAVVGKMLDAALMVKDPEE